MKVPMATTGRPGPMPLGWHGPWPPICAARRCAPSVWPPPQEPRSASTWSTRHRYRWPTSTTRSPVGQSRWDVPWSGRSWWDWFPPPPWPGCPPTAGRNSTSRPSAPSNPGWRFDGVSRRRTVSPPPHRSRSADDRPALHSPLTPQPSPFTLGQSAPDPELLAVGQGVLEAVLAHHTATADLLGLAGRRTPLGKEKVRVDTHAVGPGLPAAFLGPVHQ